MKPTHAIALAIAASTMTSALAHPFGWRVSKDSGEAGEGALQIEFLWDVHHRMNDPLLPGLSGWQDADLAFEEFPATDPARNIYPIDAGTNIALEIIDFEPGVKLRDPANTDSFIAAPGETFAIGKGGTSFFTYPIWHIDDTAEGWTPKATYAASFRLIDTSGLLDPSPAYTFLMDPDPAIPAPASAFVALAGLSVCRRRR